MNKKIHELCMKAISDVDGIANPDTQQMYIPDCFRDRFAELIVKECCDVFVELRTRPADLAILDVKKHFGVQQ